MATKRKATGIRKQTFRSAYNLGDYDFSETFDKNGLTEQHHKESCDINFILAQFQATGKAPLQNNWEQLTIPCNKCTGCRTEHSRQWAMRLVHEKKYQEEVQKNRTVFVTLTYNDNYLPQSGSLIKKDFQNFIKRLRNQF